MGVFGNISGSDAVKAFGKDGWTMDRQRGSHIILKKAGNPLRLSVPNHKEIDSGVMKRLIRDAAMTVDQFLALL